MKRQLLLLLLVLMTAGVWAQQISEEQARNRALKFLTNNAPAQDPVGSVGALLERHASLRRCQSRLEGTAVANRLRGHRDGDGDELLPVAERSLHGDSRL